ncbi:MAG: PqiC family protein [Halioglobus sp.]
MKNNPMRYLGAITLIALLAGCGTTPQNNYYLLSAQESPSPSGQSPALGIGPIEIPEYLNRNGLVYNRDGNQLHIAAYERWAEPIANGVERVMGLNLAIMLDTENVQTFPWYRSEEPDYGIQVTVIALDANDSQATLVAEWVVQKPKSDQFLIRRLTRLYHDMPTGEVTPEQIAPAYSALLYQLSQLIADKISKDLATAP